MRNVSERRSKFQNLCTSCRSTDKQAHKSIHRRSPRRAHTHTHSGCVLCVCVFVSVSVFCHSFRAQLLSFASTTKANLIKLFVHAYVLYIHIHIPHAYRYTCIYSIYIYNWSHNCYCAHIHAGVYSISAVMGQSSRDTRERIPKGIYRLLHRLCDVGQ